jgi:hypothetical protein
VFFLISIIIQCVKRKLRHAEVLWFLRWIQWVVGMGKNDASAETARMFGSGPNAVGSGGVLLNPFK